MTDLYFKACNIITNNYSERVELQSNSYESAAQYILCDRIRKINLIAIIPIDFNP